MKNLVSFRGVAAALVVVACCVGPALSADRLEVGDLYKAIAGIKGLPATDGITAEASLRAAGLSLPRLDLGKALTHGDVASVSSAVGIQVTSSTPDAPFTQEQMDEFAVSFGPEIGVGDDPVTPDGDKAADPLTKGKGLKKGLYKRISPSEPI